MLVNDAVSLLLPVQTKHYFRTSRCQISTHYTLYAACPIVDLLSISLILAVVRGDCPKVHRATALLHWYQMGAPASPSLEPFSFMGQPKGMRELSWHPKIVTVLQKLILNCFFVAWTPPTLSTCGNSKAPLGLLLELIPPPLLMMPLLGDSFTPHPSPYLWMWRPVWQRKVLSL
jgi:hypothetical protein